LKLSKPTVITIQPDKLWQITLRFPPLIGVPTNCWLWNGGDGLTLIDCGCPNHGEEIVKISQDIGAIKRVIITHAHPDHAGAAAAISRALNVPVFAHEKETDFLSGKKTIHNETGSLICRCVLWFAHNIGFNVPKVENLAQLKGEQEIEGLQILHTPGHTPGSISIFAPSIQSLFCGDNLDNLHGKPALGQLWCTLDKDTRNSSLGQFDKLDANRLLAGHGRPYESNTLPTELKKLISTTSI
jgi:glyoxylase-like metal-dependent hydrolase (beta-lactamase superfamily II)